MRQSSTTRISPKFIVPACLALAVLGVSNAGALTLSSTDINSVFDIARQKYMTYYNSNIATHLSNITNILPVNSNNSTSANTEATFVTANSGDWRAGFFGGVMWEVYGHTGNSTLLTPAENLTFAVHGTIASGDHDVGFRTLPTYVQGSQYVGSSFVYTLNGTTDNSYQQQIFAAANFLQSRYQPAVGVTRSWNDGAPAQTAVIVDNMMNIQLLFKAAQMGDTNTVAVPVTVANPTGTMTLTQVAIQHARTTFQDFVRADGSSVHEVIYDTATGAIISKQSAQGIKSFSDTQYQTVGTWSRGQSWLINGFTQTYKNTGMAEFLSDAQTVANYWCTRTLANVAANPGDPNLGYIPPTDFDVSLVGTPDNPNHQDTSAAAIAADGLLQLAVLTNDQTLRDKYWSIATNTLLALENDPAYFNSDTTKLSLFIHSGQAYTSGNQSNSFLYTDYFFLDALNQYQALLPTFTALDAAPEPTSIGLLSLPAAAALLRRRRSQR